MSTITAAAWRHRDYMWYDVRMSLSGILRRSIKKAIKEEIKNGTTDPQAIFESLKKTLERIRENVKS